jgi:DNA end-binding protein Ku
MSRVLWKGAISFGLLHAPVTLYPASQRDEIDFDWLKRDTLQPIGYKRVIKETGEEVGKDDIIKGVQYEEGRYALLSDEEIKSANVKSSHTIDMVSFADAQDLSFLYFETPYYLAPTKGGEKVYVLLREALLQTKKIGIALIVLHNKQHLAAVIPTPNALVLNTLRWATEVKDTRDLDLPPRGLKSSAIREKELAMATQLIESMSEEWDPTEYKDTFRDDIMALVQKKIKAGEAEKISKVKLEGPEEETESETDLSELLRQSLQGSAKRPARKSGTVRKTVASKPPAPVRKAPRTRSHTAKTTH